MTEVIPHDLRTLLGTLGYIGQVKPGQKCFVRQRTFIEAFSIYDPLTWIPWYRRHQSGESIVANYATIQEAVDQAIDALTKYKQHSGIIIDHLARVEQGLNALSQTYKDQPGVLSDLNVLRLQLRCLIETNAPISTQPVAIPVKTDATPVAMSFDPRVSTEVISDSPVASTF